jgi:ribonucrease Y
LIKPGLFIPLIVIASLIALGLGFFIRAVLSKKKESGKLSQAKDEADKIILKAKEDAERAKRESELQAKDTMFKLKSDFEREAMERRQEIQKLERKIEQNEEKLDKRVELIDRKEGDLNKRESSLQNAEKQLAEREKEYADLLQKVRRQLEENAGISSEEAKRRLMKIMESEAKHEGAKRIKQIEDETKEIAEKKAKWMIATALERYAGDYVSEKTVSVVNLPSDEMKGRIIGREGRNIRTLEAVTGIDLIIDETPEAVILSGFNPVRREVAKVALERLVSDGRIHPARIEEIVKKVEKEVDQAIKEAGEKATFDIGVHGIHPEILKLIGSLKYRTSFMQNQYQHSLEVAHICGMLASELGGMNIKQAKRAGLLHDIGKAIDHEIEGSHAVIGAEMAKKYGEHPHIAHAIGAHHDEYKTESLLDFIVAAADAISGARPGARREILETYIKRLEDLEKISNSFQGVSKSYAIQAGREVRVMVESDRVNDDEAAVLSRDLAKKIQEELTYPGQIKVIVIRETRAVEFAK